MSDLQLGLAILGLMVIVGVVVFNWWQERQFHNRARRDRLPPETDVLLPAETAAAPGAPQQPQTRIEPQLDTLAAAERLVIEADGPDPALDYIAELRAGEAIAAAAVSQLASSLGQVGRRIVLAGYDHHAKTWEALGEGDRGYTSLRAGLQLVDRSGPASIEQLQTFQSLIRQHAKQMSAIVDLPDIDSAISHAGQLDAFCSDVDVVIGINVIAHAGQVFHGTRVRALAEASGLKLQANGVFVCPDEEGSPLFTLDNQEAKPFLIEQIRHITTPGITFLLDVPRARDGLKVFDRMVALGRQFADSLDGLLADDNRQLLSDAGLDQIRTQLRGIYNQMEARGLPAGGPGAMRLFA